MTRKPTIGEIMRAEVRAGLLAAAVLRPAVVRSYAQETRTATVQLLFKPVVRGEGGEPVALELPELTGVPVWWPQFGGFQVEGELVSGDVVGVFFADRATDRLFSQTVSDSSPAETFDPGDPRAHALSDAIAVPGLMLTGVGAASERPLILRHLSGLVTITISPDGNVAFDVGEGGELQSAVRGEALVEYLRTHTHLDALGGTGPPASPPPQDVLSQLLRLR